MSSVLESPEAESQLPEAAPPRVSESRQEVDVTGRRQRSPLAVHWASFHDGASQHQLLESEPESEEEGEEEEREEELRGVFIRSRPQVICTYRCLRASLLDPDWDEGEPPFPWPGAWPGAGARKRDGDRALGEASNRGSTLSVKIGGQWHLPY